MKKIMQGIENLAIFTAAGSTILGVREGSVITGYASANGDFENNINQYLMEKAVNNLTEIEVGGGYDVVKTSLTNSQRIQVETAVAQYKSAMERAKGWVVNRVFSEIASGK